jgi:amino-acid N-acetyltransferase
MQMSIENVRPEDRPAIVRLLSDNGLPTDGLPANSENVLVARLGDRVVASAALEIYPDGALLRSVAVEGTQRGSGIGHRIVRAALDLARQRGTESVYLLTTTAETFFPRFGFRRITRAEVPTGVQTSVEFQSACPVSAVVMVTDTSRMTP